MKKIWLSIFISLFLHDLVVIPISAKNTNLKNSKFQTINLKINKITIVPSKVMEEEVITQRKTFHGKVKQRKHKIAINRKPLEDNKVVDEYLIEVRKKIIKNYAVNPKGKKMKLKGKVLAKLQIQRNGYYDVLYVGGEHRLLEQMTQKILDKIDKFPEIPRSAGQKEIQLKIPLVFDLSK